MKKSFAEENPINTITNEPMTGAQLKGRVLVFKPSALIESYRQKDRRFLAQGGFGCNPSAMGTAVYGVCLEDGEKARWERYHFMGFAADSTIPAHIEL